MLANRKCRVYWITFLLIAIHAALLHLVASPDDAVITPLQRIGAALSNCLGPWGVIAVRLVDFPNAGLRDFSLGWALALTAAGIGLILAASRVSRPVARFIVAAAWFIFVFLWFGIGFVQIASGLL